MDFEQTTKLAGTDKQYVFKFDRRGILSISAILFTFTLVIFFVWGSASISVDNKANAISESWATSHCVGLDYLEISNLISGWYSMIELISTQDYDQTRFQTFVQAHFVENMRYYINQNASFISKTIGIQKYFGKKFWNFMIIAGIPYIQVNFTANYGTAKSSLLSFSSGSERKGSDHAGYQPMQFKSDGLVSSNWYFIRMNDTWFIQDYQHIFNDSSIKCQSDVAIASECSLNEFEVI